MPTLSSTANNFVSRLASAHTSGSGTFVLAAGDGARLASALTAAGFGPVSATAPVRFRVTAKESNGVVRAGYAMAIFTATGRSTDTLTGCTAVEGTADTDFGVDDYLSCEWTAGMIADAVDILSGAIAFDNDPADGQVPAWVAADGVAHWSDPAAGIGSGPWSFVDDTNTAPTAYFEKSYAGTYPSGGWDNAYAALEIANRDQTDGNVAYVSFSGHGTGGFSSAVLACVTTSHASHYGKFVLMTRAADGLLARVTVDENGVTTTGLTVGSLSGLLKASSGVVSTATAGTDYLAPAGVSGGQTVYGDTASGGSLTLRSTAHATKGTVTLGPLTVDEANGVRDAANDAAAAALSPAVPVGGLYRNGSVLMIRVS